MANTAFINSDQITSIASSMKTKGDNILTEYKQNCIPALNMSTECLQLSGLDTTEFFKALEFIYTKLNERITEFSDFLTNTVAVEYDFTSKAIAASFNEEFANEISGLLGISVGGIGSAAGVGSTIPGTTGPGSSSPSSNPKNPSTSPSTKAPTAVKTEPPIISNCSGYYKPVKNCSGGYSYVKVGENETVIRNCSGQLTVVSNAAGSSNKTSSSSSTQSSSTGYKPGGAQSSYAANGSTSSNSTGSSYAANPNAGNTSTSSSSTSTGTNRRWVSSGSGGYLKYY